MGGVPQTRTGVSSLPLPTQDTSTLPPSQPGQGYPPSLFPSPTPAQDQNGCVAWAVCLLRSHRTAFLLARNTIWKIVLLLPACKGWGKVTVSVCCQSTPGRGGGGGTPSPSHNTSTGPMSFLGGTPVTGTRSLLGGIPQSWPGAYPTARTGVPPSQVRMVGYPSMEYPSPPARD